MNIQVFKHDYYLKELKDNEKIVYSLTAPRGRIYDRNGILLVDNEPIKIIRYSKLDNDLKWEKEYENPNIEIMGDFELNLFENIEDKELDDSFHHTIDEIKNSPCPSIGDR